MTGSDRNGSPPRDHPDESRRRGADADTDHQERRRTVERRATAQAKAMAGSPPARAAPAGWGRALGFARKLVTVLATEGVGPAIRRVGDRRARLRSEAGSGPFREDEQYRLWLEQHEPSPERLGQMREKSRRWKYRPLISVVVPVYNPDKMWLDAMVNSVRSQVYDNWELCLADDLSSLPHVRPALSRWAADDGRIKVAFRDQNGNIAAASNSALALATGEFVALLDHDDVLRPHALHRVVDLLQEDQETDMVYSDEDKILVDGQRGQVHFKGEFDPDYLLSTNYVSHLSVIRRDVVSAVGGFRSGLDGSQDHDLVLRVSERARRIRHVTDVLYSWRQVPGSAALEHSEKPAAWAAGRHAVADALARRHPAARAELGPSPGLYIARYPIPPAVRVTAIVMAVEAATTARSLAALRRTPGLSPSRWVLWGDDAALEGLREPAMEVIVTTADAQPARLVNELVAADDSEIVVLLSGDLAPTPAATAWLEPLLEQAMRTSVGVVGGRIVRADGSAEQDGLHVGGPHLVESVGVRLPVIQRVGAVSADCMAMSSLAFSTVGGFDDRYRLCLHDVDLCLRLRRAGLATLYTPLTELRRLRPPVRRPVAADDSEAFRRTWEGSPEWTDPFVSPWLEMVRPFTICRSQSD